MSKLTECCFVTVAVVFNASTGAGTKLTSEKTTFVVDAESPGDPELPMEVDLECPPYPPAVVQSPAMYGSPPCVWCSKMTSSRSGQFQFVHVDTYRTDARINEEVTACDTSCTYYGVYWLEYTAFGVACFEVVFSLGCEVEASVSTVCGHTNKQTVDSS